MPIWLIYGLLASLCWGTYACERFNRVSYDSFEEALNNIDNFIEIVYHNSRLKRSKNKVKKSNNNY